MEFGQAELVRRTQPDMKEFKLVHGLAMQFPNLLNFRILFQSLTNFS